MATLAIIPSLPVRFVAPDKVLLTHKFVEGMALYAKLWDGPVIANMHPNALATTGNLDDEVFSLQELPFEVRCADFSSNKLLSALADADAVMLGGDHRLKNLTQWCRKNGKKAVYLTEYSLKTRLQIIDAEVLNPIIRWRKYFWEWRQERRNQRSVAVADAVQCNGTPTYDAYRQLNPNTLLFHDSRVTADMLADSAVLAARHAAMRDNGHIRLAYSGRLTAMKGADDLVEVARHLKEMGVAFTLDIFGEGMQRPVMAQRISEYKLEQQVKLHGIVDYATELQPFVKNSVDLFVCCHRQGDPACTYLETMACGVPVAGYANEALTGLTENREVGWTTALNQPEKLARQIATLYQDQEQLCSAGKTALEFARTHTFENEFGMRIAQIRELLSSG